MTADEGARDYERKGKSGGWQLQQRDQSEVTKLKFTMNKNKTKSTFLHALLLFCSATEFETKWCHDSCVWGPGEETEMMRVKESETLDKDKGRLRGSSNTRLPGLCCGGRC